MKDYVQSALLMELPIATFAEHFKITFSGKVSLTSFFDTSNKLLKHCIFTDSLLIVNYIQRGSTTGVAHCSFGGAVENATLGKSYR